jgi:hypothetical protein
MKKRHPGATGVATWTDFKLAAGQRDDLAEWVSSWKLERLDVPKLVGAVEAAVKAYREQSILAEQSSAKAIRRNLSAAADAAAALLSSIENLDGNSSLLLGHAGGKPGMIESVQGVRRELEAAYEKALERYPNTRRPTPERDFLATLILDALRRHSSASPSSTKGGIFEELLGRAFEYAGEKGTHLHTRCERALKARGVVELSRGVTLIDPYDA